MERRKGIYQHPEQGEMDVFQDADATWMYRQPSEIGDIPESWWDQLTWVGPRTYPPPQYWHPDLGTFGYLSRCGIREVYVCDCCGTAMDRGGLPNDQWPEPACQWCPQGRLIKRLLNPTETLADDGPDFARSPFSMGGSFLGPINWRDVRAHLVPWRTRAAARLAGKGGWVYRIDSGTAQASPGKAMPMSNGLQQAIAVGSRVLLIHVTPGKAYQTVADVPVRVGTVQRVWRKKYATEDCALVRFDDGKEWSGLPLSHLVALDQDGRPVVDPTASTAPTLGEAHHQRPQPLVAGDFVELIRVDPCKLTPSLESVPCRTGKVVRIYTKRGAVEPVAHVWFDDGVEWLGLPFDYLLKLGSARRPGGGGAAPEAPGDAPAVGGNAAR